MAKNLAVLFFITLISIDTWAQEHQTDSLHLKLKQVYSEIDSLFNATDSTSALDLIDRFLTEKEPSDTSRLQVRLSYNSNISALNQTLGIKQYGLFPGISYYHKSGLYTDVSAYWSNQFAPPVYLTTFSAGYLNAFSKKYLFNLEYTYFLYAENDKSPASYTNSISLSNQFDVKPFQFKLDYYYYFGNQSAHRILPNVGLILEKKNWGNIIRFSFTPSLGILFGTESTQEYVPLILTPQQLQDKLKTGGSLYSTITTTVFGLMNYSLNLPFSLRTKHWVYQISYTYNVPKSLPNEELSLTNTGYLSASIARYIKFK